MQILAVMALFPYKKKHNQTKKNCRQKAVPSAKSEASLMDKFVVQGNRLSHFIFSSRSDVLLFLGAGYREHIHT